MVLFSNDLSSLEFDSFLEWLCRTKMTFFGVDLDLPWWFGLSSWHYALYGISLLLVEPQWARRSFFPYKMYALWMIFVQSPLSFSADYLHMSDDSVFHVLDRMGAVPAAGLEVFRLVAYIYNGVSTRIILTTACLEVLASSCYIQSTLAQAVLDRDAFVMWHYLWHMYPILASIVIWIEYFFFRQPSTSSSYWIRRVNSPTHTKKYVDGMGD